jgi:hypothetical protein
LNKADSFVFNSSCQIGTIYNNHTGGSSMKVTAPKTVTTFGAERSVEFTPNFGGDLQGAIKLCGSEKVVYGIYEDAATVKCASVVRAHLQAADEKGQPKYTDAECIAKGLAYIPAAGATRVPKDPYAALVADVASGKITPEELIKTIKAKIAAAKQG